ATGVGGAACDRARRNDELWCDRESTWLGRGLTRRRRRQRRQPDRNHCSLSPSDRFVGLVDRLRRRSRSGDLASRPRAPLALGAAAFTILTAAEVAAARLSRQI